MTAAMGRTSCSANSRATAWIILCSSLSSMFILLFLRRGRAPGLRHARPPPPPRACLIHPAASAPISASGTRAPPRPPPAASSRVPHPPRGVSPDLRDGHPGSATPAPRRVFTRASSPRPGQPRSRAPLSLLQELLELGGQERHHLEEVSHDPVVGDLEDRRLGILVHRADHFRGPHPRQVLDGARDAEPHIELGRDGTSGLSA